MHISKFFLVSLMLSTPLFAQDNQVIDVISKTYQSLNADNQKLSDNNISTPKLTMISLSTGLADTDKTLNEIKLALNEKTKVNVAALPLSFNLSNVGAIGTYQHNADTWIVTPQMLSDMHIRAKHDGRKMIITGYDDNAVAIDERGRQHKGLLTFTQTSSDKIKNPSTLFMSYDYFKLLLIEAQHVGAMPADGGSDLVLT